MIWDKALPYFPSDELACRGAGIIKLDIRFAAALPALRQAWGKPLSPSSVCRTPDHNKAVGGHPSSLHLTDNPKHNTFGTMAADILWGDWHRDNQLAFARLAYKMGWSVGLHDVFCHIDRRTDIGLYHAVFLYGQWAGHFTPDEVMQ